jgi:predicted GNAT family acetyltransferase
MGEPIVVTKNDTAHQFEAVVDGQLSILQYRIRPGTIVFTHTEVPPTLEGKGVGAALARAALDFARQENLKVLPLCSFVAAYIKRHPEYADLVRSPKPSSGS